MSAARKLTTEYDTGPATAAERRARELAELGDLLDTLERAGVRVYLDTAGALRHRGPHGAVTATLRRDLLAHKGAITRALRTAKAQGTGPAPHTGRGACASATHAAQTGGPDYSCTLGRWLCRICEPASWAVFAGAVARAAHNRAPGSSGDTGNAGAIIGAGIAAMCEHPAHALHAWRDGRWRCGFCGEFVTTTPNTTGGEQ